MAELRIILATGLSDAAVSQIQAAAGAFAVTTVRDDKFDAYKTNYLAGRPKENDSVSDIDHLMTGLVNHIQVCANRGKDSLQDKSPVDIFD